MGRKALVPTHLSTKTKAWYAEIEAEYELEVHDLLLLQGAAESWDRCQQAREMLAKEGLTFTDRHGNVRPHPATQIERDSKSLFARLMRELGLSVAAPATDEIRPPTIAGKR
jgi:P27 family predicted phage terminase small subunit